MTRGLTLRPPLHLRIGEGELKDLGWVNARKDVLTPLTAVRSASTGRFELGL